MATTSFSHRTEHFDISSPKRQAIKLDLLIPDSKTELIDEFCDSLVIPICDHIPDFSPLLEVLTVLLTWLAAGVYVAYSVYTPRDIAIILATAVLQRLLCFIIENIELASRVRRFTPEVGSHCGVCPCGDPLSGLLGSEWCGNCQGYVDWQMSLTADDPDYDPLGVPVGMEHCISKLRRL